MPCSQWLQGSRPSETGRQDFLIEHSYIPRTSNFLVGNSEHLSDFYNGTSTTHKVSEILYQPSTTKKNLTYKKYTKIIRLLLKRIERKFLTLR